MTGPTLLCAALLAAVPAGAALKNPGTVIYAHAGEVTTLDPSYSYDATTHGLLLNVYDTLIRFSGESLASFSPALASKIPTPQNGLISADRLSYTFPLRRNVKFHGGGSLSPEDVRYSLLRFMLLDPEGGPAALLLEPVFGLTATRGPDGKLVIEEKDFNEAVKVSGDSVTVRLKKPFAPFLSIMARWSYILDKDWCVKNGDWDGKFASLARYNNLNKELSPLHNKANGTGPFRVDSWSKTNKRVELSAFDAHWSGAPRLRKVVMRTVPDFPGRRWLIQTGDADIIDLAPNQAAEVQGLAGVVLRRNLPRMQTDPVLFFNYAVDAAVNPDIGSGKLDGEGIPPDFFSSADIRKGFASAFDYAGYLKAAQKGGGARSYGAIPPGMPGYSRKGKGHEYDPAIAVGYFMSAYGGEAWKKGFRLTVTYNKGGDLARLACETLKRGVEALNPRFKVEIRALEWPVYLQKTQARKLPVFASGWTGDYPDPHNFAFPFYHSRGRYPLLQGWADPEMDKFIEAAVAEKSTEFRMLLYSRVIARAYETAPQIYTGHPDGLYALRAEIEGFYDNPVFMGVYFYPLSKL